MPESEMFWTILIVALGIVSILSILAMLIVNPILNLIDKKKDK